MQEAGGRITKAFDNLMRLNVNLKLELTKLALVIPIEEAKTTYISLMVLVKLKCHMESELLRISVLRISVTNQCYESVSKDTRPLHMHN